MKAKWTPTVEETRAAIMPGVDSGWIVSLDDDECLNAAAIDYIRRVCAAPDAADVHYIPFRHYILSRHDERAYYWPEYRPALFRKGAVEFVTTVHGGCRLHTDKAVQVAPESGAAILHLSHRNASVWVEKTNRYTDQADRLGAESVEPTKAAVRAALERWLEKAGDDPYLTSVAALRGVYDVIDLVKRWEATSPPPGFAAICADLNAAYDRLSLPRR